MWVAGGRTFRQMNEKFWGLGVGACLSRWSSSKGASVGVLSRQRFSPLVSGDGGSLTTEILYAIKGI